MIFTHLCPRAPPHRAGGRILLGHLARFLEIMRQPTAVAHIICVTYVAGGPVGALISVSLFVDSSRENRPNQILFSNQNYIIDERPNVLTWTSTSEVLDSS